MSSKHPPPQKLSADIATRISGSGSRSGFLGVHLRPNDGDFLETDMYHSRMICGSWLMGFWGYVSNARGN